MAGKLKETYGRIRIEEKPDGGSLHSEGDYLDDKGITEKAWKAYDAIQEHFDAVSGAKILRLVEERGELAGQVQMTFWRLNFKKLFSE